MIQIPDGLKNEVMYNPQPKISKIIHQTYKSINLPITWKDTPKSWMDNHSTWEYVFWDDEDNRKLVVSNFPEFLPIFDSYLYPIQRADAVRYMILYTYGGIYADMDLYCKKPIDKLFYDDADVYLLKSPNAGTITNCFMASKKGAKFWLYVIQVMTERARNPSPLWVSKHIIIMNTTGPAMLQSAYDEFINVSSPLNSNNFKGIKGVLSTPYFKFLSQKHLFPEECNVCVPKPCTTPESYITILQGSSWCGNDTEILTTLYCHYQEIITLLVLGLILIYFNIGGA